MLQKITNLKSLFKINKTGVRASIDSAHGSRCILHIANLALLGLVIMLSAASVLVYYLIPVITESDLSEMIEAREMEITDDAEFTDIETQDADSETDDVVDNKSFSVINEKNMFSHMRKEWVVKAVIPNASERKKKERAKKGLAKKKALAGKPKKIILHGVVIAGDLKRALINNPLKGVSKKTTMYVEEGDELEGYKVTSIEKDKIRLDWHGEEIIVTLYSGLKDSKKSNNSADNTGRRRRSGLSKLDYRFKVVEDAQVEESLDVEPQKVAKADTLDEALLDFEFREPEFFSMPDFDNAHSSVAVRMQDVNETFPDVESNEVDNSKEEQENVTKLEYKFKVIDDHPAKENSDVDDAEVKKVALADIPDEASLNLVYNEPEYLSMLSFEDAQLSGDSDKIFSDIESNNRNASEEGQKTLKAQEPPLIELAVIEKPKQNHSTGGPAEILLHGIVIVTARDIKKALVNIPMSPFRKERTLYVEEGDRFEGYKVTSIEPDKLRIDWHGEEMVVKFPPL